MRWRRILAGAIVGGAVGGIIGGAVGRGAGGAVAGAVIGATTGAVIASEAQRRNGGYYWWHGGCYYRYPNGCWVQVLLVAICSLLQRAGLRRNGDGRRDPYRSSAGFFTRVRKKLSTRFAVSVCNRLKLDSA